MPWPDDTSEMTSGDIAEQSEYEAEMSDKLAQARAEGYAKGLEDAVERALKRIDGLANGAQCSERIAIILAHVRATGRLPGEEGT